MSKAVLVDVTRCIGCRSCQVACKQWNEIPAQATRFTGATNPPVRSAKSWTRVEFKELETDDGAPAWRYVKQQCMHCLDPACASVCPVGAMTKTPEGPVVYDVEKCFGCRYCVEACPFGVPAFQWDKTLSLVRKCQMCDDRVSAGLKPACVTACPAGALQFGEKEPLVAKAQKLIADNPTRYVDHVYGKDEVGGTAWLYVSDVPFEKLGMKTRLRKTRLPSYTWKSMAKVPWIAVGVGALMTGLYFYTHRRNTLAQKKEEV